MFMQHILASWVLMLSSLFMSPGDGALVRGCAVGGRHALLQLPLGAAADHDLCRQKCETPSGLPGEGNRVLVVQG